MSLTATHSMSASAAWPARKTLRPIRPKPLIPTRTGMVSILPRGRVRGEKAGRRRTAPPGGEASKASPPPTWAAGGSTPRRRRDESRAIARHDRDEDARDGDRVGDADPLLDGVRAI